MTAEKCENEVWISLKDGSALKSEETLKLLGFIFNSRANCNDQVTNLIRKASCRAFLLSKFSKFMSGDDLKKLYFSLVRSILEYSAVTIHSQISKYQSNRLEKIQKQCLRIMYGYGKTYSELLQISGLQPLSERRTVQFEKFALNAVKNPVYEAWFPLNRGRSGTRNRKIYQEKMATTDRLYNSPVYAMRRLLNGTPYHDRFNNPKYQDLSHIFNDPY